MMKFNQNPLENRWPERRQKRWELDKKLVVALLESERLTEEQEASFTDIQGQLGRGRLLSEKQRAFAESVADQLGIHFDEEDPTTRNANVPRSKGPAWSDPPAVLRNLPKKPPPSRRPPQ